MIECHLPRGTRGEDAPEDAEDCGIQRAPDTGDEPMPILAAQDSVAHIHVGDTIRCRIMAAAPCLKGGKDDPQGPKQKSESKVRGSAGFWVYAAGLGQVCRIVHWDAFRVVLLKKADLLNRWPPHR